MMDIKISDPVRSALPSLKVLKVEANITNRPTGADVEQLLRQVETEVAEMPLDSIKSRPGIAATRLAYKILGKEPNRYRPAAEALCRRIVRGLGLYRVNAAVDIINVLSIKTGYSIGGFDMDKIDGDRLTLGVGEAGEPYTGIGRGQLNIEHLPVFRDNTGGVGTPTSDNERTCLELTTSRLLLTINMYGEEMPVKETCRLTTSLLETYLDATDIRFRLYE